MLYALLQLRRFRRKLASSHKWSQLFLEELVLLEGVAALAACFLSLHDWLRTAYSHRLDHFCVFKVQARGLGEACHYCMSRLSLWHCNLDTIARAVDDSKVDP